MNSKGKILLIFSFLLVTGVYSQCEWLKTNVFKDPERKKQFWIYWGYNRSQYTKSDIHFEGQGYDFTLFDVKAKDRQSPFDAKVYFNPRYLTIPQFNIRGGYFLTERLSVSIGYDHMKYVVNTNQMTTISGYIDSTASEMYAGNYSNESIQIKPNFVRFEHTDGLNYVTIDVDYYGHLWKNKNEKQNIDFFVGYGAGILYPRSEVSIFNKSGANLFHFSGWGTSVHVGLRFDIIPNVFLNISAKGGFIQMNDVLTVSVNDKAQHKFFFAEQMATFGFSINALNKKWKGDIAE